MENSDNSDLLNEYFKYIKNNVPILPPVMKDIERFSTLHSWYKHMGKFEIAYPLLLKGEEPRYPFEPRYSDLNQSNFHWRFILSKFTKNYGITINNQHYEGIPQPILEHMKKYPIYFNNELGTGPSHLFQLKTCENVCELFYEDIVRDAVTQREMDD